MIRVDVPALEGQKASQSICDKHIGYLKDHSQPKELYVAQRLLSEGRSLNEKQLAIVTSAIIIAITQVEGASYTEVFGSDLQ
jgi:hypothetical protein